VVVGVLACWCHVARKGLEQLKDLLCNRAMEYWRKLGAVVDDSLRIGHCIGWEWLLCVVCPSSHSVDRSDDMLGLKPAYCGPCRCYTPRKVSQAPRTSFDQASLHGLRCSG
jgi:hypothetical protein